MAYFHEIDPWNPLPVGTVIRDAFSPHTALTGPAVVGQNQEVAHNSKEQDKAVRSLAIDTFPSGLVMVDHLPESPEAGWHYWNNALNDIWTGRRWRIGDNCEDFVSRAITGHDGSPTRNGILFFGSLVAAGFVFASSGPQQRRKRSRS